MNVDYEKETFYKIIVIGDAGVGKTNLVFTFDKGKKPLSVNPTIGTEFTSKTLKLEDGRKAKTQIWDTAGQEQFKAVTMNYYRGAAGALIVFDINNHSSFEHVMEWYSAIRERADSTVQIGLVGHKADSSKRSVSRKQAEKFADAHNIFYMQTTVNDPQTIKTVFSKLLTQILNTKQKPKQGNILLNQSFSHDGNCTC